MEKRLFTSECVTNGHPDKVADSISDAILDACLAQDPHSRVACETMVTTNFCIICGEITTKATVDYAARQEASNYKYAKSWLALALPIAYCILDAAGTFADDLVLETLNEDSANVAYELTFLAAGIVSFIYTVVIKKQKLLPKAEGPKYVGAAFFMKFRPFRSFSIFLSKLYHPAQ